MWRILTKSGFSFCDTIIVLAIVSLLLLPHKISQQENQSHHNNIKTTIIMFKFTEEVKKLLHLGSETAGKVFVLDGADPIGHRVVERLIDSGYTDLRVGVRTTKQIITSGTTEFVPFMWEDETTYDTALDGVKTVFMTLPIKPDDWDAHFVSALWYP